jgi:hypothetical protein
MTRSRADITNGAAMAAFLAAGIGAFAMGFFVIANEAGILPAPSLYAPAGGVSGRTTFAVATWLIAWVVLHSLWKSRRLEGGRIYAVTLTLVALGILGTFPPVWGLF